MRIVLHPDAKVDIAGSAAWYEDREPGLGIAFVEAVSAAISRLSQHPQHHPKWPGALLLTPPVQRYQMKGFPAYAIAFRRYEDQVVVIAVAHAARRPFFWVTRASK